MQIDYLIRMANDIGAFFASDPDPNAAAASIHSHIRRFWDPRMRAQIVAYYNETQGAGLEGPVLAAIKSLAAEPARKAVQ
jgi:formate dehydrogenase subunit delta